MAYDYTAWPTAAVVQDRLAAANITPRAAVDADYYAASIDAVTSFVQQDTKVQFLPGSAGEVRYFDGSGTGIQEVDPYITVTQVKLLGFFSATSINVLSSWALEETALYPKTRISIFRGSLPAIGRIWLDAFPDGRKNVEVTGTWGYSSSIPKDLWWAVAGMAAGLIADETAFDVGGRIISWMEGAASEKYDPNMPSVAIGWLKLFRRVLYNYRKPLQTHLNHKRNRMI